MTKALANGKTNQTNSIIGSPKPGREAIGPTNPTRPKPPEAAVPLTLNIATGIAQTAALAKKANPITGRRKKFGIIIFIDPKAIANVTPGRLTLKDATTRTAVVAATPIAEAPAATPSKPIVIDKATVDKGDTIKSAKHIPIKILIESGANAVKLLIT